jgi:predicted ATPase
MRSGMKSSEVKRVLFVGGAGAGKTAVLDALRKLGFGVADDPARAIIRARKVAGLSPRPDPDELAQQLLQRDIAAYEQAQTSPAFFERGVPDAVAMLLASGALQEAQACGLVEEYPYFPLGFSAGYCERCSHEFVINHYVGPHTRISLRNKMCINYQDDTHLISE